DTNSTRGRVASGRPSHCFCAMASSARVVGHTSGQWVKPRNTTVQWPCRSDGCRRLPSDCARSNDGISRGWGSRRTVASSGGGAAPVENRWRPASRPRPAANATTRMMTMLRLNMAASVGAAMIPGAYNCRPFPAGAPMTEGLSTIIDLIRFGASRFNAAGLTFGHSYDNAVDEATQLVLHALHLPHDLGPAYGQARVTAEEKAQILALFKRRIEERIPAAYLTGEAWFAGLSFKSDARALVPRSPIAELIESGFEPWLGELEVGRAADLCTGSGCIAIAMAHYNPNWEVVGIDISDDALALAEENKA